MTDSLLDILNTLFDPLYEHLIVPCLLALSALLKMLISPLGSLEPRTQIVIVALLGAILSRILANRFRSKREKKLAIEFKEKMANLKYAHDIQDKKLRAVVKKGMSQDADKVYENILLDKFFEMGISYFLPLFSLLIWLEYDYFTAENLKAATGSPYAWVTESGLQLSAAWLYLYAYNIFALAFWFVEFVVRFAARRIRTKAKKTMNTQTG